MAFEPGFGASHPVDNSGYWFIVHEEKLVVRTHDDEFFIPSFADVQHLQDSFAGAQFFGRMGDKPCFLAELTDGGVLGDSFELRGIFELLGLLDDELLVIAGCAMQLIRWDRGHKFCGQCGKPTENKIDERAKICPSCGLSAYPRLSPAVIVAVVKGDRLLLGTSKRFRADFWSVLAGFVEPGETLEECVVREVREEVGILVKNVHYFGSQPWPFPDSLMIGFTAQYAGGEITVDQTELTDANWFTADDLPRIPPKVSIARRLIDWFVESG
jgi:NAD+ diphosphatase